MKIKSTILVLFTLIGISGIIITIDGELKCCNHGVVSGYEKYPHKKIDLRQDDVASTKISKMEIKETESIVTESYQKPVGNPKLRPYVIVKNDRIWHPQYPSSYIINDDWVKYYASQLYIGKDGDVFYKYKKGAYDSPVLFSNNYVSDDELFNFPPNGDYWQNPDYYLSHGMRGDCEDFALTMTSMLLSGEISVLENDKFVKKVVPAKVVVGFSNYNHLASQSFRDAWVEYNVYNTTFRAGSPERSDTNSVTFYADFSIPEFDPIYEFSDKIIWRKYTNKF